MNLKDVEYLQCSIIDHKGKPMELPYFIVHVINPIPIIDPIKCGATWNILDPEYIKRVRRISFLEDSIQHSTGELLTDRKIFRDSRFSDIAFIRRDLADSINAEGFTGLDWIEISDFPHPGAGSA